MSMRPFPCLACSKERYLMAKILRASIVRSRCLFILEKSVGHRKDIQDIDVNSELRACVDFCDPTDFSRFMDGR